MSAATIHVRFTAPGFHRWADAPVERAYLAHTHRHLFHVEVRTTVKHDDREIEFHDLRDLAVAYFEALGVPYAGARDFGGQSCEMLARDLARGLSKAFKRDFIVSVFEDGEVGATVEAKK